MFWKKLSDHIVHLKIRRGKLLELESGVDCRRWMDACHITFKTAPLANKTITCCCASTQLLQRHTCNLFFFKRLRCRWPGACVLKPYLLPQILWTQKVIRHVDFEKQLHPLQSNPVQTSNPETHVSDPFPRFIGCLSSSPSHL